MIDERINALSLAFSKHWNDALHEYPRYYLDFTWPSIGTLDNLLEPIRFKQTVDERDTAIMLGAACYLTTIWHSIWSTFPDIPEINAAYSENPLPQIQLSIKGGKHLRGDETVTLDLMPVIWEVVRYPQNPFPYFEKSSLPGGTQFQRLPLFVLGFYSGASPYYEGPWKEKNGVDIIDYLVWTNRLLAESTAEYYKNVFLSEEFGAQPECYIENMIFPPPGNKQIDFITRPIFQMIKIFQEGRAISAEEEKRRKKWLENIATIPNQCLSLPALAAIIALQSSDISRLAPLVEAHQGLLSSFHPALEFARSSAGSPTSPEDAVIQKMPLEAAEILKQEAELGLIPWFLLDPSHVVATQSIPLLHALSTQDWPRAAALLERHAEGRASWYIQAGLFYCFSNIRDEAERIRVILPASVDSALPGDMALFEAAYHMLIGDFPAAFLAIEPIILPQIQAQVYEYEAGASRTQLYLTRLYISSCVALNKVEHARRILRDFFPLDQLDVILGLDAAELLSSPEDEDTLRQILYQLAKTAPNDPRIMQLIAVHKLPVGSPDEIPNRTVAVPMDDDPEA